MFVNAKRALTLVLMFILCLCSADFARADSVEDALKANMNKVYEKALSLAGRSNFSGLCGMCTGRQLQAAGVFNKYVGSNGTDAYSTYKASKPTSGVSVTTFPGKYQSGSYTIKQICNLMDEANPYGENVYAAFCFDTGSASSDGQKYGHVLLVHAVYNGRVYWTESFGTRIRVASISSFANTYAESGTTYHFDGAVVFGYKELKAMRHTTDNAPPCIAVSTATTTNECRLQRAPYDQSKYHLKNLERGTIVYIGSTVKNSYGNTWYEIVDVKGNHLGYIWEGDLEVTEREATFYEDKLVEVSLLGIVKTNDGYLKEKPYEAAHHSTTIVKGKSVTIVASYTNSHGNLWYKTSDGYFIYSGDVTTYKCTPLFNCSLIFTNTEKRSTHDAPYLDSPEKYTCKKGEAVAVTRFVRNSHGNIWAQLSNGSFICFYDYEVGKAKLEFYGVDYSVSGVVKPTGDLPLNKSFGLAGKVTVESPMLLVTAKVTNEETGKVTVGPVKAYPSATTRTININGSINGVNINNKMPFKNLKTAGWYHYEVVVQLGFTDSATGKTFTFGDKTVVESHFTAGSPVEDEKPLPDVGGTQIGTSTTKLGDVNEDGKVDTLDALLILKYMSGYDVTINVNNADCNSDGQVDTLDALRILQYMSGYVVTL